MIEKIIEEIKIALENKLYFIALNTALILPDICGKAEFPDMKTEDRYKEWVRKYIVKENYGRKTDTAYPYLNAYVIYKLRCSCSHQGTPSIEQEKTGINEFVLTIEETDEESFIHSELAMFSSKGKYYQISLRYLCFILCKYALRYYEMNKEKFTFFNYKFKEARGISK